MIGRSPTRSLGPVADGRKSLAIRQLCRLMANAHIPLARREPEHGAAAVIGGSRFQSEGTTHMASAEVQQIITQMGAAIGDNSGLGGILKFDFGEPGSVLIDGKSTPNTVTDGEGKTADTTISVALSDFEKMVKGELDGTSAFMQGKLRVAGDMGLAMKIGSVLQKARG
jgi:putative sterol carrier protein